MEIQSLKLFLTDDDLAVLARRALRDTDDVEALDIHLTPEGVQVSGQYPTSVLKLPFETLWQVSAAGPEVHVRLSSVKVAGMPAGMLNGALMKMVRDAVDGEPGVRVQDDTVVVHLSAAARARGLELLVRLSAVRLSIGAAVIEAG